MNTSEARFTPAREFCPKPQYWHSRDSESTEEEVSELVAALVRAIQPEYVVETGTAIGVTTWRIGRALYDNGHGRLVSLDNDLKMINLARDYIQARSYAEFNHPSACPIEIRHQNTMDFVPEQNIDFAFFDSWQEGRDLEFLRYRELGRLHPDTIVLFHDTAPHHMVLNRINKLEQNGFIKTINLHTPRGVTIAQVLK